MKLIITMFALTIVSLPAFAATKVQTFSTAANYAKFVQENPSVKVVAVTPITTTTDNCANDSTLFCANVHTSSLIVTFED